MENEIRLSVVIITFNEQNNIERCIRSVQPVADEIVVVDSYSTDRTEAICAKLGAKFIRNKFEGHIQQKNYAVSQASNDIVLSLDADEALSDKLARSVLQVKKNWKNEAYCMKRLTSYCGKWIRHGGWYPDTKIRLWDRKIGKWGGSNPHDTIKLHDQIKPALLKGDILHYSYHTIAQHVDQMNKFSEIAADEAFKKGKKSNIIIHLILYPLFTFLRNYILKLGILDGYYGFVVCKNSAYYRFLKYAKLRRKTKH